VTRVDASGILSVRPEIALMGVIRVLAALAWIATAGQPSRS